MKLSITESRVSRMWVKYLSDEVKSQIENINGAYIIDIAALRSTGIDTARIIEEAVKRFGAEKYET